MDESDHASRSASDCPDRSRSDDPVPIFDAHSDLPLAVRAERARGRQRVLETDWVPAASANGIVARVAAVYVEDDYLPEMALRRALETTMALREDVSETPEVSLATDATELAGALDADDFTLLLGLEGAEPLGGSVAVLEAFAELGVRLLTLVHSRRNAVASGVSADGPRPGGLSAAGEQIVETATDLGVAVDVSHLNDPGFWDVVEQSTAPIIASHSNCQALTDHPRNLTDAQLRGIADTGGVVGISAVGPFIDAEQPTLDQFLDHVDHAVDVVGIDHVAFGFDFFEYLTDVLAPPSAAELSDLPVVEGLRGDADVSTLGPRLQSRGYDETDVAALAGENLQRVLTTILP